MQQKLMLFTFVFQINWMKPIPVIFDQWRRWEDHQLSLDVMVNKAGPSAAFNAMYFPHFWSMPSALNRQHMRLYLVTKGHRKIVYESHATLPYLLGSIRTPGTTYKSTKGDVWHVLWSAKIQKSLGNNLDFSKIIACF